MFDDGKTGGSDLRAVLRAALSDLLTIGLSELARIVEAQAHVEPAATRDDNDECAPPDDREAVDAAAVLGVALDASPDEIRAALRSKLGAASIHPDHGGDGDEAKRLIAAKNLLIARTRERRAGGQDDA